MVQKTNSYKAYIKATSTVAKTRQVVMLYDGAIRFLKQGAIAIREKRIEARFHLLNKSSEIIVGLQSSIDFENGDKIAHTLHGFYTQINRRILAINFIKDMQESEKQCNEVIADLKQMRDVWDSIDQNLSTKAGSNASENAAPVSASGSDSGIVISA